LIIEEKPKVANTKEFSLLSFAPGTFRYLQERIQKKIAPMSNVTNASSKGAEMLFVS
jgi:hypothetical protein